MLPVLSAPAERRPMTTPRWYSWIGRGERLGRRRRVAVDQDDQRPLDSEQVAVGRLLVTAADPVALDQDRAGVHEATEHLGQAGAAAVAAQVHDPALAAGLLALLEVVIQSSPIVRPVGPTTNETGKVERRK